MVQDVIGTRQIRSQPTFFSQILFDPLNKTPHITQILLLIADPK
jgi:hypothetical protein